MATSAPTNQVGFKQAFGFKIKLIDVSGTKHFLLMCNVRPEDSGEIRFVARHVDSVAKLQVKGKMSPISYSFSNIKRAKVKPKK